MEKIAKRILPELQRGQAGVEVTQVAADKGMKHLREVRKKVLEDPSEK